MRFIGRNIKQNNEGATSIEFAIVAWALFYLMLGIIEFGLVFFTNVVLEGATNIGSRIGKTGYSENGLPREEFIRQQIRFMSGGFLDDGILTIEMLSYDSFANVNQAEPCPSGTCTETTTNPLLFDDINGDGHWSADRGIRSAGTRGAVVLYRVTYPWTAFTPLMQRFIGTDTNGDGIPDGPINLTAIATVRNERF